MNRIILIGNGFDLAHNLKTAYKDFINDYWGNIYKALFIMDKGYYEDENMSINVIGLLKISNPISSSFGFTESLVKYYRHKEHYDNLLYNNISEFRNRLLFQITARHIEKWVDVEYEYFRCMQQALKGKYLDDEPDICKHITVLNNELARIETLFTNYLDKKRGEPEYNDVIKRNIFSAINIKDLSTSYVETYFSEIADRVEAVIKKEEEEEENSKKGECDIEYQREKERLLKQYSNAYPFIDSSEDYYVKCIRTINRSKNVKNYIKECLLKDNANIHGLFIVPKEVMFVNFNYTDTLEHYLPKNSDFIHNKYIHGQLNNPKNPIIFGYGDELCSEYEEFEDSAEGEFLKNVKSIRYLETDNYRKLLEFADADKFQIFLMGHSCGLSDRTLLNTLFEHDNCVSIKPFYYIKKEGTDIGEDDYNDIVRNISRNFTDKAMMRDRVVNKTYCTPLSSSNK